MTQTTLTEDAPGRMREKLRAHLHQSVQRRRRLRKASRIGMGGFTCAVLVLGVAWFSGVFLPGAGGVDVQILAVGSTDETRIQRIPTTSHVRYVSEQQPGLTRIPTQQVAIAILTDTELLDTFSEQAYAVLADEDERIQAFYLLADMTGAP